MRNLFFACALLFSVMLFSQHEGSIAGTVTDQAMNNEPLLFANVQLKGADKSYQTNFHGNFEIPNVKVGEHILIISYAGYDTKELNITVTENAISRIATDLSVVQISFDNVIGMNGTANSETTEITDIRERQKK